MYKHILFPTDGSSGSKKALKHVIKIAQKSEAKVSLLHVYQMPLSVTQSLYSFPKEIREQSQKNIASTGDHLLKEIKEYLHQEGIQSLIYNIEGTTKTVICDFASEHQCDLIIMGTRGSGSNSISGNVNHFGSTCSYVIHHTPGIPVLVVD